MQLTYLLSSQDTVLINILNKTGRHDLHVIWTNLPSAGQQLL